MADDKLTVVTTIVVWLKRLFLLAFFIVMLVFFVNFTLSNTQQVSLEMLGWSLPSVSSSTLVMVPFILGGILGLMGAFFVVVRLRLGNASLKRKLVRRDSELQKLRTSALKGLTDA